MEALQQYYPSIPVGRTANRSIIKKFMDWCKSQEKNRLLWLAVIVTGHGCILTPFTVMMVMFSGNSMFLWALALGAMAMSLVSNLAALPAKITIPIFMISLAIDVAIITASVIAMV